MYPLNGVKRKSCNSTIIVQLFYVYFCFCLFVYKNGCFILFFTPTFKRFHFNFFDTSMRKRSWHDTIALHLESLLWPVFYCHLSVLHSSKAHGNSARITFLVPFFLFYFFNLTCHLNSIIHLVACFDHFIALSVGTSSFCIIEYFQINHSKKNHFDDSKWRKLFLIAQQLRAKHSTYLQWPSVYTVNEANDANNQQKDRKSVV